MSNQVYENDLFRYIDASFLSIESQLPQPAQSNTLTLNGPFTSFVLPYNYVVFGPEITFFFNAASQLTTNGTSSTMLSSNLLPLNIRPINNQILSCPLITNASTVEIGLILINSNGTVSFFRENSVLFPTGQQVGVQRCQITYTIQ